MRIVLATPLYPPEPGGPATYAKLLEDGLPKEAIGVSMVKFSKVRIWPRLIRHFLYEQDISRALKNADAVLALDPVSVGLPALRAAQKANKPFFVKVVGDYAWEQGTQRFGVTSPLDVFVKTRDLPFPVQILRNIQTNVAQKAKKVIVPSQYLQSIVHAWGIPEEKIEVIYNGITLPQNIPVKEKSSGFHIVSAGRRVPWKGFEAIEQVVKKHGNWSVDIISDVSRIEALARIKAGDVFVLNSEYEGLSHLLIETMTLGVPVIVTSAGGNKELVTHEETGLLIPPKDDAALEAALLRVVQDPTSAKARAEKGKEKMQTFTESHMLRATAAFFVQNV